MTSSRPESAAIGGFEKLFWAALATATAIRLFLATRINLLQDEAYYWTWCRSLDVCYYDQPGMIAWINFLSTRVVGGFSEFWVRAPMILLSAGSSLLAFRISLELFGSRERAALAGTLLNVTPLFLLGGFIAVHDLPLTFFWILSTFLLTRLIATDDPRYLYLFSLSAAATMYSKFTGVFVVAGAVLFVLLSPKQRKWLTNRHFWTAVGIGGALFTPAVLWNAWNGWPSYRHISRLGSQTPPTALKMLQRAIEYQAAEAMLLSPLVYAAILTAMVVMAQRWWRRREDPVLLLLAMSVPGLLYFTYLSTRTSVFPNWSAFAYLTACILLAEALPKDAPAWLASARYQRWAAGSCVALSALLVAHVAVYLVPSFAGKVIRKDRLLKETLGWPELGRAIQAAQRPDDVIICFRYQVASEVEFYHPDHPRVMCLDDFGRGRQFSVFHRVQELNGKNVLAVVEGGLPAGVEQMTSQWEDAGRLDIPYRGQIVKQFKLMRGIGLSVP